MKTKKKDMKNQKRIIAMLIVAAMLLTQISVAFAADSAPSEQFKLTLGGTYYFDLSAQGVPGTINGALPDTSLKWVPFTYVGTVNAYSLNASSTGNPAAVGSAPVSDRSLFVADFAPSNTVSWNSLNSRGLIFGKDYNSRGVPYKLRSLSVGNFGGLTDMVGGVPTNNEWDQILNKSLEYIKNSTGDIHSWGQDTNGWQHPVLNTYPHRSMRGGKDARGFSYGGGDAMHDYYYFNCFRPALEVLNPTALGVNGLKTVTFDMGTKGTLGNKTLTTAKVVYTGTLTLPEITAENGFNYNGTGTGNLVWYAGNTFYAPGTAVTLDNGTVLRPGFDNRCPEQFNLATGTTYYFDLSAQSIPGTRNDALPDTSLKWIPFTYVGTIEAYSLDASTREIPPTADNVTISERNLFVSRYQVTYGVSWNSLYDEGLIFDRGYSSGGVSYKLRSPSAGIIEKVIGTRGIPDSNEWDRMLDKDNNCIENELGTWSWGQDLYTFIYRARRGGKDMRVSDPCHNYSDATQMCYRPILEVLNPDALGSNGLKTVIFDMGGQGTMGNKALTTAKVVYTGKLTLPAITEANGFHFTGSGTGTLGWYAGKTFYAQGSTVTLPAGTTLTPRYSGTPPTITTASLPGGNVGKTYKQTLAASGDMPMTWTCSGILPTNLSLSSDGIISGMPTAEGTFNFTVKASNDAGYVAKALSIVIGPGDPAPSEQFSLASGGTYYFDLSGQGIPGTINRNMPDPSLKWVPFTYAGTVNAYSRTAVGNSTNETVSVSSRSLFVADYNVTYGVTWNDMDSLNLIFGKNYSSGGISYKLRSPSVGSTNNGLTNETDRRGIPESNEWDQILNKNTAYIKNLSIDSMGQDTLSFYENLLCILRGYNYARYAGNAYSTAAYDYIGWRPALEVLNSDALGPDGLKTVTFNMGSQGTIGGNKTLKTATVVFTGTLTLPAITAANGFNYTGSGTGTLGWYDGSTFYEPGATPTLATGTTLTARYGGMAPSIVTTSQLPGTVGVAYTDRLVATGDTPITWSIESGGSLPAGLSLNASTGNITGTPTVAGTFNFTAKATNTAGSATRELSIIINEAPDITGPATMTLSEGYTATSTEEYTLTGYPVPAVIKISGHDNITWNSGTKRLDIAAGLKKGEYSVTLRASNGISPDKTLTFILTVNVGPTIVTQSQSNGIVGVSYSDYLVATGDTPITWSIESGGSLPAGLSLNASTGNITGTPTVAGTFNFTVKATNTAGSATRELSIIINEASYTARIEPDNKTFNAATQGYDEQVAENFIIWSTGTGTITGLSASLASGSSFEISEPLTSDTILPGGTASVKVRPKTGLDAGDYIDTLTITGDNGLSVTASLSFTVNNQVNAQAPAITKDLTDNTISVGTSVTLDATATVTDGGTITYEWYSNTARATTGATALSVTSATFSPDVSTVGITYYYCVVTNTNDTVSGVKTAITTSAISEVKVNAISVVPSITGPTEMSLTEGYSATATGVYTVTGTVPVTVSKTSGDSKITWNDTTKKLDIAAGLEAGCYPVILTASNGIPPDAALKFTLTVNPVAPVVTSAAISPGSISYDLSSPADIVTTITWNSASTVTDVIYGTTSLTTPDVYVVSGNLLIIKNSYLNALEISEGDIVKFNILFDKGDSSTLTVNIVDSYIPAANAELKDMTVNGDSVNGFDPNTTIYNVELPYGTAFVSVGAIPNDEHAAVAITQAQNLPGDATVLVTAEDKKTTKSYTIHFTLKPATTAHSITAQSDGNGKVSANVYFAPKGTEIILSATPNSGYRFKEWQVVDGGMTITDNKFIMPDNNVTVKAIFEQIPATVYQVTVNGSHAAASGSGSYAEGLTVTINAGSRIDYAFNGWTSNDGIIFADARSETTTFIMPAGNVTVTASWNYSGGSGDSSEVSTTSYSASVSGSDASGKEVLKSTLDITVNSENASMKISSEQGASIKAGGKVVITVLSISNVTVYTVGLPAESLSNTTGKGSLSLQTGIASILFPANMLSNTGATSENAKLSIAVGDKAALPEAVKAAIGNHPLVQLSLKIDEKEVSWNNPQAPVAVSIPYTPSAAELANPESIVIWYIDGSGNAVSVSNGHYDVASGTVTFTTTHFSSYAVGYNRVSFTDVAARDWYSRAVSFIAARKITAGTDSGNYSPDAKLTRGEFIVMLLKAYDIAPEANAKDNFADSGKTWYTDYLAAAKRLGISEGIGNNMFAPDKHITRQEMFTLLYNALKVIERLPEGKEGKTLANFIDTGDIASWAKDAMTLMVKMEIVGGSGGKLSPTATTTRAEMAQVLYNLLSK